MRPIPCCLGLLLLGPVAPAGEPGVDRDGQPLPPGALARFGTTRLRHTGVGGEDTGLAFRPDSRAIASLTKSSVRLWDLSDGKRLWHFESQAETFGAAFSPDGKRLALCSAAGVRILASTTGRLERWLTKAPRLAPAFSPDGSLLAVSHHDWGGPVELWEVATGKRLAEWTTKNGKPAALAFSDDGKTLRAGLTGTGGGSAIVWISSWDIQSKESRPEFAPDVRLRSFELSDNGRLLATRTAASWNIRLWDTTTGQATGTIETEHHHFNIAPGGKKIITSSPARPERTTQIGIWDVATGKRLNGFTIPAELGEEARLSPDGKLFATTRRGEMLCIWDAQTGERRIEPPGHGEQVTRIAFADGDQALVSTARDVRTWDIATAAPLALFRPALQVLGVRPGTRELIIDRDGLRRVDLATGRDVGEPFARPQLAAALPEDIFRATAIAHSPDGRTVAVQGHLHGPRRKTPAPYEVVWDVASGRPTTERALPTLPRIDAITADRRLAVAAETISRPPAKAGGQTEYLTGVKAFDVGTGRLMAAIEVPGTFSFHVAITSDGQTVATVSGNRGAVPAHPPSRLDLRLWEVRTGRERMMIPLKAPGHYDPHRFGFSADGRLVGISRASGRIEVLDVTTGRELVTRSGFESPTYTLAFNPDGRRLASGHTDGTILLWEIPAPPAKPASEAELESAWIDLASDDAVRANAASWLLASAPKAAVKLLAGRLKPTDTAAVDRIRVRIADLDSKSFQVRESAATELAALAGAADAALREALRGKLSAEQRERVQRLLEAPAMVSSPELLRVLRAIETLERIGTPEALGVLKNLAGGAVGHRSTREAQAAVARLAR